MVSKNKTILKEESKIVKQCIHIQDFLNKHKKYKNLDLDKGISILKKSKSKNQKLKPSIQIAQPDEAKEISEIFKQTYNGTYPYKELESEIE
ncbi:unnamed protein product, partial [marine sediment metagenome]